MKRLVSWMLVLCMALSLVPAGLAEEFFAEESFIDAAGVEGESLFFEEGFAGGEFFFGAAEDAAMEEAAAVEGEEEDQDEDEVIESRSIVSLITDNIPEPKETDPDWKENSWKIAPKLEVAAGKSSDQIVLTWTVDAKKMGDTKYPDKKMYKFYLYEINNKTGVAYQVGKPFAPKYNKKLGVFSNKATLKKQDGNMTYFVRIERLTPGTNNKKLFTEAYGASSNHVTIDAVLPAWNKKPTKVTAAQQGDAVAVSWTVAYPNHDGFKLKGTIGDEVDLKMADYGTVEGWTIIGNTHTYVYPFPDPDKVQDGDAFSITVTPYKKLKKEDTGYTDGTPATSKAIKLRKGWVTLSDFEVEEEESDKPTEYAVVEMEWTVPSDAFKAGAISYTLTGLMGKASFDVSVTDDKAEAKDTTKKNSPIMSLSADLGSDTVEIELKAKAKLAPTAKISVQPKQGKIKGLKTTATIPLSCLATVTIFGDGQTGDNTVRIRFTQGTELVESEIFNITGFANKKLTVTYEKGEVKTNDTSYKAELEWNEAGDAQNVIVVEGPVKPVKKETALKFSVKPQVGKKKGKASAKFVIKVRPAATAAAMGINFGPVKPENKMDVNFKVINKTGIKEINVSLVEGNSFTDKTAYQDRKTLIPDALDKDGNGTVTFDGVEKGKAYTAFVEVILDEGRVVDTLTSLALGEFAKDPRLTIDPEKVDGFQTAIENGALYKYVESATESRPAYMADKVELPVATLFDDGTDISDLDWEILVDDKIVPIGKTAEIAPDEEGGKISFMLRPVIGGAKGDWVGPIEIEIYKPLKVTKFNGPAKAWNVATFEAVFEGGSGNAKLELNDGAITYEIITPEDLKIAIEGETGTEKTFTVLVTDNKLQTKAGVAVTDNCGGKEVKVTKSAEAEVGPFTYMLATGTTAADKKVQVVGYNKDKYEETEEYKKTSPKVPDKVTIEDVEYVVVEIGAVKVGEEYHGAFQGMTDLVAITLPNAITTIGVNAFKDCTNLATMECYGEVPTAAQQ